MKSVHFGGGHTIVHRITLSTFVHHHDGQLTCGLSTFVHPCPPTRQICPPHPPSLGGGHGQFGHDETPPRGTEMTTTATVKALPLIVLAGLK
jgi:hypothetical protein